MNRNAVKLSPEAVAEFRQIYAKVHGELLSVEVAEQKATELVELMRLLTRPYRDDERS